MTAQKIKDPLQVCQYFKWRLLQRDGVYYADGRGNTPQLGKYSLGTRDREEALDRLRRLDVGQAIDRGIVDCPAPASGAAILIRDGWAFYLDYCGRSEVLGGVARKTHQRYRAVGDRHIEYCARQGLELWAKFDKVALERYGNLRSQSAAYRTQYFELTLLKSVNRWLIDNGYLAAECQLKYPLRRPQGTDTYCYTPTEVAAMIAFCRQRTGLVWLADVLFALAHTGLRISELATLRWSDVNMEVGAITIADERASHRKRQSDSARRTKGRRSRTVPIHGQLKVLLENLDRRPDGLVFHGLRGKCVRPRIALARLIERVIEPLKHQFPTPPGEIGFEHGRLHSFRHYFCSQAFLGGASEGEVKDWLGHSDSKMVDHYRHLRHDDARRRMDQLEFLQRPESDPVTAV